MTVQHNGTTDPNEGRLNAKEIYAPLVELVIHGQDNKLNLFSSFLFFQSILLLAWATVWQTELAGRNTILLVFSIFGVISSGPWAVTGSDYADASRQFCDVAEELEKRHFPNDIPRFLSARGETVRAKAFGGRHLIGFVAWGFAVLYVVLEFVVCKSCHATSSRTPRAIHPTILTIQPSISPFPEKYFTNR